MSLFGKVFGKPTGGRDVGAEEEEEDSEVERLLQQVADARHAGDRRDAMSQLSSLLQDNPRVQYAISSMGLPVLLSVLAEDRDDLELLKGAVEVLQLSVALPDGAAAAAAQQMSPELCLDRPPSFLDVLGLTTPPTQAPPPPALINADLICRAPDNVLLLLGLLRPEPEGCEDFYVRYGALQTLNGLLRACPDKLQACVLSSPLGVTALMDLLSQTLEVLRNEALLLLVGLCNGCPQIAHIAAFEGAFEKLLAICGAEGGPAGGDVIVQDAAELINNMLRDNLANQRLFREMGHINQLPGLLVYSPPPAAPPSAAAGIFSSASQYMDPSLRAAAGAAANAAANSLVGAAAAAAVAAAGAAASAWPVQVAANFLCLMETARVLLAAPHSPSGDQQAQEQSNRRSNQDKLGQLGLMPLLVALSIPGAPSGAVRAQALFCLGDLVWDHAQLQEQLAGQLAAPPAAVGCGQAQPQPIPYLQAVLQVMLHGAGELEHAGASHLLAAFCASNNLGQMAVLSTVVYAAVPHSFGEELLAALLCQHPAAAPAAPALSPTKGPSQASDGSSSHQLQQQLTAGRAAMALSYLLAGNQVGQTQLLALQVPAGDGPPAAGGSSSEFLMTRVVKLLQDSTRRADGKALPLCYSVLRLLVTWCGGCTAAVSALLSNASHLPLLVDLIGRRVAAGDVHTAGLAAVFLGVCLINAPGSPMQQQQQQLQPLGPAGSPNFDQLLDVLLSRVGLSQFFGAVDEMKSSGAFQAAKAAPRLPAHITRAMAAALLEAEAAGAAMAAAAAVGASGALASGALGLLSQAADSAGAGAAAGAQPHGIDAVQPYDRGFTQQAEEVAAAVQQLTLNAFSAGGGSTTTPTPSPGLAPKSLLPPPPIPGGLPIPGAPPIPTAAPPLFVPAVSTSSGAAGPTGARLPVVPGGLPPGPCTPSQQQQHPALPGLLPPPPQHHALLPQPPLLPRQHQPPPPQQPLGAPHGQHSQQQQQQAQGQHTQLQQQQLPPPPTQQPQQQQQQLVLPDGPLGAVAAQLAGDTAEQKLLAALEALLQLQGQVEELRSRNRSLAEDLIRVSQSKPGLAGATANGGPLANGTHEGGPEADADARVAAQLRASRAEMEAGALKQQLATMQDRWSALEADAAAARQEAEEARAAAGKAEADLGALSTAYNDLEEHAFRMEEQLKQAEESAEAGQQAATAGQQQQAAAAAGGLLSEEQVEARIQAALEKDRQQRQEQPGTDANGDEAGGDVEARIAAAVSEAQSAAEAEAGEEMEDLLACLGEEQAKVEVLSDRLAQLGEDVNALLATVAVQEEAAAEEELL